MPSRYSQSSPEQKKAHNKRCRKNTDLYVARNQKLVLDHLKRHPCVDCGESDPVVLDFDHIKGVKKLSIGLMIRRGTAVDTLMAEMDKCVVRCANCHRRKTGKELGWFRSYSDESETNSTLH